MKNKEPAWQWREIGESEDVASDRRALIETLSWPYQPEGKVGESSVRVPPPICYPGTTLDKELGDLACGLILRQLNHIGAHDHGGMSEGGFESSQEMERDAIRMMTSVLGGDPDTVEGFFCGGGTEANTQGLWIGREWLHKRPDPACRGIVVFTTPLTHYSVEKAVDLLGIGRGQLADCSKCGQAHLFLGDRSGAGIHTVAIDDHGRMDMVDLERQFRIKYQEGFRRFMAVPTIGTSVMGSVDPVNQISNWIDTVHHDTGANIYVHVDAAFGGFTVPFVDPDSGLFFGSPNVMSVSVDADKMGGLPYPAGGFFCRRGLSRLVGRKVMYVRGGNEWTIPGSRSAVAPVLAWYWWKKLGLEGQRAYVQQCLDARDKLASLIVGREELRGVVSLLPADPRVNFLPMKIDFSNGVIPEGIREKGGALEHYHLRGDFIPGVPGDARSCPTTVYKICIMPHTFEVGRWGCASPKDQSDWMEKPWTHHFVDNLVHAHRAYKANS